MSLNRKFMSTVVTAEMIRLAGWYLGRPQINEQMLGATILELRTNSPDHKALPYLEMAGYTFGLINYPPKKFVYDTKTTMGDLQQATDNGARNVFAKYNQRGSASLFQQLDQIVGVDGFLTTDEQHTVTYIFTSMFNLITSQSTDLNDCLVIVRACLDVQVAFNTPVIKLSQ